jgi:hypothetical protein
MTDPGTAGGPPHRHLLAVNTLLWRIHSQKVDATAFTPARTSGRLYRGPFDCEPRPGYNAGLDAQTHLADLLLPGIPVAQGEFRTLRRARIRGMRASAVPVAEELSLINLLTGPALAAADLTYWLLFAEEHDHGTLGEWANRIRATTPWAQGVIWPTGHDHNRQVVMLFRDRCEPHVLGSPPVFAVDLDDEYGAVWLNGMLAPYRTRVAPPGKVTPTMTR